MTVRFSWNLVADIQDMWSYPFMVNAFRAGTLVAVLAALIGWFMVLRRQSFAGHTLAVVGFPGAAVAVYLGLAASLGYFLCCVAAALAIAVLPALGGGAGERSAGQSAAVGTVQAFALATGALFVSLYHGFLTGTTALLFGGFLGITDRQVLVLAGFAVLVLGGLAIAGRPLLFSSVDARLARAGGVPTRALDVLFLVALGITAAEVSQITGALLVFALLVLPPATARRLTTRIGTGLALAVLIALLVIWAALFVAYYSPYPIGFWLTSIAFAGYLLAGLVPGRAERA